MAGTLTTVEKTSRNKTATIIGSIFLVGLFGTIIKDFYYIFHEANATLWDTIRHSFQVICAMITLLWLFLLMIASPMTISGRSFKKTLPYTLTFLVVLVLELFPRIWTNQGYLRIFWVGCLVILGTITCLQMIAFSLKPNSSSVFRVLLPFRSEIVTAFQPSPEASSINLSSKKSTDNRGSFV